MKLAEEMRDVIATVKEIRQESRAIRMEDLHRGVMLLLQDAVERREGRTPDRGMTYSVSVQCQDCKAVIRFENEKPEWKDLSEEIEAARKWVEENPEYKEGMTLPRFVYRYFLDPDRLLAMGPGYEQYIECPACGGEAPMGSGPEEDVDA